MKELQDYRHFMQKEELHKSLNDLVGILLGISADGIISASEQDEVQNWYSLHEPLINKHPFSEILPLVKHSLSDGTLDIDEVENVLWLCNRFLDENEGQLYFDLTTSKLQQLEALMHGIISDGSISDRELDELSNWLDDNDYLAGLYPFDEVYSLLLSAKEDGHISQDEQNMLKAFFATFVNTKESFNIHEADVIALQEEYSIGGVCAVCPEISFSGKTFCFTGTSQRAKRDEIAALICAHGGLYSNSVTGKTDYLVVGADGNPCWAFSCYGRKVEKAVSLRKQGKPIVIIHEYDLWDELGE